MSLRLLSLLCLLLLSEASLTQESGTAKGPEVPDTCPVTKAADHSFVPPYPYPAKTISGGSWFGTDRLWIALPEGGIWRAADFSSADSSSGKRRKWWRYAKVSWWRQGYDWHVDGAPKLKVTGRRLDSTAPPLIAEKAEPVGVTFPKAYMMDSLDFPTLGCWEITGRYENDELTFVVWVAEATSQREQWTELRKDLLARAKNGDARAESWLGSGYEQGWFGRADFPEALEWFRRAAAHGNPDAQNSLGQMYEDGEGVQRDYVQAAQWYRKAAENVPDRGGAGQGRMNLGLLYMQGLGVPKDYVQAYMWFSLSNSEANLSDAKAQMTSAQVLEAERMATEWKIRYSEQ